MSVNTPTASCCQLVYCMYGSIKHVCQTQHITALNIMASFSILAFHITAHSGQFMFLALLIVLRAHDNISPLARCAELRWTDRKARVRWVWVSVDQCLDNVAASIANHCLPLYPGSHCSWSILRYGNTQPGPGTGAYHVQLRWGQSKCHHVLGFRTLSTGDNGSLLCFYTWIYFWKVNIMILGH